MDLTQRRRGAKKDAEIILLCFAPLRLCVRSSCSSAVACVVACSASCARRAAAVCRAARRVGAVRRRDGRSTGSTTRRASPCGPATRPTGPFELFVSESGAGRVVRLVDRRAERSDRPSSRAFRSAQLRRRAPSIASARWGSTFLSRNRLAVGTGGLGAGADVVRVYALPEDGARADLRRRPTTRPGPVPPAAARRPARATSSASPRPTTRCSSPPRSGDERGWVLKATLDANRLAGLAAVHRHATSRRRRGARRRVVIDPQAAITTTSSSGKWASRRPSATAASRCTARRAARWRSTLTTGLHDVVGLGLQPERRPVRRRLRLGRRRRRAASTGSTPPQVDGRESCRAVKIAAVVRPTALAFAPDGALYVTAFGDRDDVRRAADGRAAARSRPSPRRPNCKPGVDRMSRREKIEAMLADDPRDVFLRYSLAMELDKEGDHDASLARFGELTRDDAALRAGVLHGRAATRAAGARRRSPHLPPRRHRSGPHAKATPTPPAK